VSIMCGQGSLVPVWCNYQNDAWSSLEIAAQTAMRSLHGMDRHGELTSGCDLKHWKHWRHLKRTTAPEGARLHNTAGHFAIAAPNNTDKGPSR
jgi:hypothetical protein